LLDDLASTQPVFRSGELICEGKPRRQ